MDDAGIFVFDSEKIQTNTCKEGGWDDDKCCKNNRPEQMKGINTLLLLISPEEPYKVQRKDQENYETAALEEK